MLAADCVRASSSCIYSLTDDVHVHVQSNKALCVEKQLFMIV